MTEKIKILIDAHVLTVGYQGTATFLAGLYNAMHSQYPDVELFFAATSAGAVKAAFPFADDAHILRLRSRTPALLRLVYDIPALLRQQQFHFAHYQYVAPFRTHGCCSIVTTHDVLFNDYPASFSRYYRYSRNLLFGRSIRRACIKTTVSAYSRQRISYHYGISEKEIALLPNAVAAGLGSHLNRQDAAALVKQQFGISDFILYVSRTEPRKNHLLLLELYLELELWQQGTALVLVGAESIAVPALHKKLQRLTPQQRRHIHQLQAVSSLQLEALYKTCRLFVYPSAAEGFGIPPLEAAVCGAPVLCAATTAMQDFSFFDPYRFNPGDRQDFRSKLSAILANPPSAAALRQTAMAVQEQYSWHKTAAAFYKLLQQGRAEA